MWSKFGGKDQELVWDMPFTYSSEYVGYVSQEISGDVRVGDKLVQVSISIRKWKVESLSYV